MRPVNRILDNDLRFAKGLSMIAKILAVTTVGALVLATMAFAQTEKKMVFRDKDQVIPTGSLMVWDQSNLEIDPATGLTTCSGTLFAKGVNEFGDAICAIPGVVPALNLPGTIYLDTANGQDGDCNIGTDNSDLYCNVNTDCCNSGETCGQPGVEPACLTWLNSRGQSYVSFGNIEASLSSPVKSYQQGYMAAIEQDVATISVFSSSGAPSITCKPYCSAHDWMGRVSKANLKGFTNVLTATVGAFDILPTNTYGLCTGDPTVGCADNTDCSAINEGTCDRWGDTGDVTFLAVGGGGGISNARLAPTLTGTPPVQSTAFLAALGGGSAQTGTFYVFGGGDKESVGFKTGGFVSTQNIINGLFWDLGGPGSPGCQLEVELGNSGGMGICKDSHYKSLCTVGTDCFDFCSKQPHKACVSDADCTLLNDTCDTDHVCKTTPSGDRLVADIFFQGFGPAICYTPVQFCSGGSTTWYPNSLSYNSTDTCSGDSDTTDYLMTGTCATLGVPCNTDIDCRTAVKGTGTDFIDQWYNFQARRLTFSGADSLNHQVRQVGSDTVMYVMNPFNGTSSSTTMTSTDDSWPCKLDVDCDGGSGVCYSGTCLDGFAPANTLCTSNSDCAGVDTCAGTNCVKSTNLACSTDADCEICNSGSDFNVLSYGNQILSGGGQAGHCANDLSKMCNMKCDDTCAGPNCAIQNTLSCTSDADCQAYCAMDSNAACNSNRSICHGQIDCGGIDTACISSAIHVDGYSTGAQTRGDSLTCVPQSGFLCTGPDAWFTASNGAEAIVAGSIMIANDGNPAPCKATGDTSKDQGKGKCQSTALTGFQELLFTPTDLTSIGCNADWEGVEVVDILTGGLCICDDIATTDSYRWCPVTSPACSDGTAITCGIDLVVVGNADITGTMNVGSDVTIGGFADITGTMNVGSDVTIGGSLAANSGLSVTGDISATGDLDITGTSDFTGTVNFNELVNRDMPDIATPYLLTDFKIGGVSHYKLAMQDFFDLDIQWWLELQAQETKDFGIRFLNKDNGVAFSVSPGDNLTRTLYALGIRPTALPTCNGVFKGHLSGDPLDTAKMCQCGTNPDGAFQWCPVGSDRPCFNGTTTACGNTTFQDCITFERLQSAAYDNLQLDMRKSDWTLEEAICICQGSSGGGGPCQSAAVIDFYKKEWDSSFNAVGITTAITCAGDDEVGGARADWVAVTDTDRFFSSNDQLQLNVRSSPVFDSDAKYLICWQGSLD